MRKFLFIVFALFIGVTSVDAQTGRVFDNVSFPSKILKMDRKFAIYLPADYETSNRSYPVLYLLHGAGDSQTGWTQFGELATIANNAIAAGNASPMIIVTPDAGGPKQGYYNQPDWSYEDFFIKELIPHIEKTYRVKSDKRFRAVAGLSMGGGAAFYYALSHPDLFYSACPLSASVGTSTLADFKQSLAKNNPNLPDSVAINLYKRASVLGMIEYMPDKQKNQVRWYIDCGDDDFLYEGNEMVHVMMRKKNIPHEYRVRDGGHTWTYWRSALPKVLEFISVAFRYD